MSDASDTVPGRIERPGTVRVWDPFVRLFHWSLVGLFAFTFLTADEWQAAHEYAGYVIAVLIAARVAWGFVGAGHARFGDFVRSPRVILAYLRDTVFMRARRYVGHNPAGGAMVLALMAAIAGICLTGWLMTTDAYWGVEWVEEAHEIAAFSTLGLIVLHVVGVIVASVEHRENLVRSMFTGRKRHADAQ